MLPLNKLVKMSKEIKAGNKLLNGLSLTEKELHILHDVGYFDYVVKPEINGEVLGKTASESGKMPQPIENGPYIKNGKPNGRPQLSGEKKIQFEKDVYNNQVDPDGILRDPNTGDIIDWKPGDPRKGVVDFGHTEGNSYKNMFEKYKNGEITLEQLKEFQFDPINFRLETPSSNRSHLYE